MKKSDSNFRKAMNELLNFDAGSDRTAQARSAQAAQTRGVQAGQGQEEPQEEPVMRQQEEEVASIAPPRPVMPAFERPMGETVITSDVVIDGNIVSGSNLKIMGRVQGNVSCEGTLVLAGNVDGDIQAGSMKFQGGSINGNVVVRGDMTADKDTSVAGDIVAGSVVFSGSAEGNFSVQNNLELRETASVLGNIRANSIAMYTGSRVRGMLDIGGEAESLE